MQNYIAKFKNFRFLIVILIFAFLILNFSFVSAYTPLEPLPGMEKMPGESLLAKYLSWLFRFALAAAAFLAVLQITIGGIQMIFGGASETARTNAKQRIWDAIWGLVLALGSVLILITISPQFKEMKLTIPEARVTAEKPATPPSGEEPRAEYYRCYYPASGLIGGSTAGKTFKTIEECESKCKGSGGETKGYFCKLEKVY